MYYITINGIYNFCMKERFFKTAAILSLIVVLSAFRSGPVQQFDAVLDHERSVVVLSWSVSSLDQVSYFWVERKLSSQLGFHRMEDSVIRITQNIRNSPPDVFTFTDNTLYKSNLTEDVQYRLVVMMTNNEVHEMDRTIQFTTSAVRRTWGSIKSMFQ